METNLLEILNSIDVSSLSYTEWISVGMALKSEGYSCSDWDKWSQNDKRYKAGECERKWNSFEGSSTPITGATIVQMAKDRGYVPSAKINMFLEWDDIIEYDGDGVVFEAKIEPPSQQLITYLKTLFKEDEFVGYVTNDVKQDSEGKWMPLKGVYDRTCKELISSLEKHPDDIGATFGDHKEECGAWIRFNPIDGKGVKNENITRFDYALVESDDLPIAEQDALLRRFELPIACLVHSGGKSLHAIVRVDAENYDEYRKRVDFLYAFLEKNKFPIDKQNRNPSRLSRMPGLTRNGNKQYLIATNIGRKNWVEWLDYVEGINDELPDLTYLNDALIHLPTLPEEQIAGVLRKGHKMIISGSSKAGKSFLLMELVIALASGGLWLSFKCKKTKVLYVNLEIDSASCINRFKLIIDALGVDPKCAENITVWNLRGKALPLDKLVPKLVRRIKDQGYGAVILDPIYKIQMGDENNASEMGAFCNQFDKICSETGCSTIYCHHHSKGAQGGKFVIDRSSGSGVFARDPDAIIDLIQLDVSPEFILKHAATEFSTAWRVEGSLREFANFNPINCWFNYPIHTVDSVHVLESHFAKGSVQANLASSPKRKQTSESRKEELDNAFDACSQDGGLTALDTDICTYLDIKERTLRDRIKEFSDSYSLKNHVITRGVENDDK